MVLHRHCGLETMSQSTLTTAANAGTPSQNRYERNAGSVHRGEQPLAPMLERSRPVPASRTNKVPLGSWRRSI
jgi:hypothetical protein